jgi:hypothetical protein
MEMVMSTITATDARKSFFDLMKGVNQKHEIYHSNFLFCKFWPTNTYRRAVSTRTQTSRCAKWCKIISPRSVIR